MEEKSFESFVDSERDRLKDKRSEMVEKIKLLEKQLMGIDQEAGAVNAYYAAKTGKAVSTGERAPRGSRRKEVLDAISVSMNGLTKSELLQELGIVGDKTATNAVSNILSVMKKDGVIQSEGRGSKYTVDRKIVK